MTEYTIYKLQCNELSVNAIYVGHTADMDTRLVDHRSRCNNPTDSRYNYKVYKFIRANGGFDKFQMLQITIQVLRDDRHACELEQIYIDLLGSTLNMCRAYSTPEQAKAKQSVYYQEHREECKAKQSVYYHETIETQLIYHANYRQNNRDKLRVNAVNDYYKNRNRNLNTKAVYRSNNQDKLIIINANSKLRRKFIKMICKYYHTIYK